ncbi:MAG: DNA-processing protein DprA [Candidatus Margulisiibacteriota bacterium]
MRYWVGANLVEGVGPVKLKKLLSDGSIKAVCEKLNAPLDLADKEIAAARAKNIQLLALDQDNYPQLLKQIHDPPPVLYLKGELRPTDQCAVAIVGTRRASTYGLETARRLAGELAGQGITVVSGLAMGIDAAAHEGALTAGGRTIAVLGGGVDDPQPVCNAGLAVRVAKNGALVSEYPLGYQPNIWSFPRRNRIISGLSLAVIVVEGSEQSGAMITARLGLEQGREVMAVPGRIDSPLSRGPHSLLKDGAKLVETVGDVLEELNLASEKTRPLVEPAYQLTIEEQRIVSALGSDPKHLDLLAAELSLPGHQLSAALLALEMKKAIKQLPGHFYVML